MMNPTSGSPYSSHADNFEALDLKSFVKDDANLADSEDEQQEHQNLRYVIRKTFIDVENSPNLNLKHREVQSCPNTNLLAHAMPRRGPAPSLPMGLSAPNFDAISAAVAGAANAAAYPDSPLPLSRQLTPNSQSPCDPVKVSPSLRALGSPELSESAPWGPDILAELVANAAAAVERHTPTLSHAEASPEPPSMWQTTPSTCAAPTAQSLSGGGLPDPVAAAVAFAAGGHEVNPSKVNPLEALKSPCLWEAEGRYSMAAPPGMVAPPGLTASPEKFMVQSSAWRPLLEDLVESDHEGLEEARPFDTLLMDAAKVGTARPSNAFDSLLMDIAEDTGPVSTSAASTYSPNTQQSPVLPHANAGPPRTIPEAVPKPMKVQAPSGNPKQKSATEGARDIARSHVEVAVLPKDNREERIDEFVRKWGLDARSLGVIQQLPAEDLEEVLSDFDANAGTKNVNAKFMVWMDSRLRRAEARRQRLMPPPKPASGEALADFFKKWSLDRRSQRYVQSLPPTIQCTLLESFNPPPDTRNMDAKLVAFVKLQLNKESAKCLRLANGGANPSVGLPFVGGSGGSRSASSGHYQQQHQQHQQHHQQHQQHRHHPGNHSFGQNCLWPIEPLEDCARHFAVLWGLDSRNEALLRTLPEQHQQAIILNFRAAGKPDEINRKFVAFLRNWIAGTAANGMPGGQAHTFPNAFAAADAMAPAAYHYSNGQGGGGGDYGYSRSNRRPKRRGPAADKSCKESLPAAVAVGLVQPAAV